MVLQKVWPKRVCGNSRNAPISRSKELTREDARVCCIPPPHLLPYLPCKKRSLKNMALSGNAAEPDAISACRLSVLP